MSSRNLLTLTDRGNVMIINAEWLDAMSKQHQRDFQELLPELVKKLIINSCTSISSIRMPHGDDIWARGFDGVVDCSDGNCYVPAGRSVWEFGTNENTLQKINDDYQKRTQNPLGSKIEETSFCLVTPKVWAYPQTITTWEAEHTDWKQVKIYDASVLCDWIEQTPVVCAWLLEQFSDNHTIEFSTLAHAWNLFAQKTLPAMSDSLFLADREQEMTCFFNKLGNEIVRVKAATRVEATGFVLAAMMQSPELRGQCIVINTPNTYREINQCVKSKTLILNYSCDHDINMENGNHVILCYGTEAASIPWNVNLAELPKFHYIRAFKDMGVPDAEELYTFTHGNLRVLIRRIPGTSTESKPDWEKREDKDLLAPLLFMRNINRSSNVDRAIVEQLTGVAYGNVDKAYAEMIRKEDSPIKVVDDYYILVNYEETWDVLQYNVYSTQYDRLNDTILSIFNEVDRDSKFAAIFNTRVGRSNLLQNLLENYVYFSYNNDNPQKSDKTIHDFMAFVDKPNASNIIINHLSVLAQAAPKIVVDALKAEIKKTNGIIMSLFNHPQQPDSRYMNILFALDKLTFYSESAVPACQILFQLYQVDQNISDSNSPYSSLLNALCFINTCFPLSINKKVELLLNFLKKDSALGGKLIIGILDKDEICVSSPYGRIGQYRATSLSYAEYYHAVEQIAEPCLQYFINVSDIESIVKIINCYTKYYPQFLTHLASLLKGNIINVALLAKLNYYLRKERFEILRFRMVEEKEYIPAFETWIKQTDNHILPSRWLFWDYYDCPDTRLIHVDDNDTNEDTLIFDIRKDAIEKIWWRFGMQGVKILLSQMENIHLWGKFLAEALPETYHTEIAHTLLQLNRLYILAGLLDVSAKETFYAVYAHISADKRLQVCDAMSRMDVVDWLSTEEEKQAYCSGKHMLQYDENTYRMLITYYPAGLLHYCAAISETQPSTENIETVMNVLTAIKNAWQADSTLSQTEKCLLDGILKYTTDNLYSDKWGKLCTELYLTNIFTEIPKQTERYFFEHPYEFIRSLKLCKETNYRKFRNIFSKYCLPVCAYTDFESLKRFSELLIAEERTDLLGEIYGRAISGTDGIFPNESIRDLLEQFDSDELDLQVYIAYINDRGARVVLDGSDQMQKSAKFIADAQALSISYPHTAAILQKIADDYRREGKRDRLHSEL
nr:MAG TPA: hypothetical protein [Caudoviricetes sp.]